MASFDGPFTAGLNPLENRGLAQFNQNVFGTDGLGAQQDAFLSGALNTGERNPFLDQVKEAAIRPILQNAELEDLRDRAFFTQGGQKLQGSSAFVEDRGRDIRESERQIGDISAQLEFADFQ
ncbi:MAG: hypothetical protein ACYSTL_07925, partial [Planctomycetota bacterium]